jgi:hypothetical protein
MRRIASLLLMLPPQEAAPVKPVPPPAGSGVHVTSKLESSLAVRFTADGKDLRKFDRTVEEHTDVTIEVVSSLAAGLTEKEAGGLESPTAPPPFVRLFFGDCPVKVTGPEGAELSEARVALEDGRKFFIERAAAKPTVRSLYPGAVGIYSAERALMLARVLADADAFVVGPRFAPLVLARKLEAGATFDVPPEVVAPLAAQAVADGTVTKAQLTFRGGAKEGATELLDFAITLVVEWKGGEELPAAATFELAGELKLVKATAQPFALELSGPVRYGGTGDENGAKLEITGTGNVSFTYRAEPLPAR